MSLSGLLLGLIDIAIVLVILVLIGAVILWVMSTLGWAVPQMVQRLYLAVVALIALYMLVALLFGIPSIRLLHAGHVTQSGLVVNAAVLDIGAPHDRRGSSATK